MRTPAQFAADAFATMPINEALGGNTPMRRLEAATASRDAEWRRLVEEAQGERDRLKGELAEFDALSVRLAKELAEARRLINAAPVKMRGGAGDDDVRRWTDARDLLLRAASIDSILGDKDLATDCRDFLAATPAEQAQGEAAKPAHPPLTTREWLVQHDFWLGKLEAQVAEVAKLVTQLQDGCAESGARRATETAALAKRVDVIEEWARRQVAEPWFDPERRPAPPPPEAAGPGHAFVPGPGLNAGLCWHPTGKPNDVCGTVERVHAVPPIAGGGAR
jgi:hypothetical protein